MIAKYRGLTLDTKRWAYGYYFVQNQKHYIYQPLSYIDKRILHWSYEVIPESVGHFTGLHDKKGKETYFSDRLKSKSGTEYEVVWIELSARFEVIEVTYPYTQYSAEIIPKIEVIGNIHENPELIKESK